MSDSSDSSDNILKESPAEPAMRELETTGDVDISLLRHSLAMTPWERMQANDDALNFAETLRVAMEKRNAKSQ